MPLKASCRWDKTVFIGSASPSVYSVYFLTLCPHPFWENTSICIKIREHPSRKIQHAILFTQENYFQCLSESLLQGTHSSLEGPYHTTIPSFTFYWHEPSCQYQLLSSMKLPSPHESNTCDNIDSNECGTNHDSIICVNSILFPQLAKKVFPKHSALWSQRFHMADIRLAISRPWMCYCLQNKEHDGGCVLRHSRGSEKSKGDRIKVLFVENVI